MNRRLNLPRLLAELLAGVMLVELAVMLALPYIAPGIGGTLEAVLDATILSLFVAPFMVWRCSVAYGANEANSIKNAVGMERWVPLMSAAALLLGLALTVMFAVQARQNLHRQGTLQFDRLAERLTTEFERRVNLPVYGLKGARGVYAASKSVERLEFRAYVESRNLPKEFPGVISMGFIQRVLRPDLEKFIAEERADAAPDFTVRMDAAGAPDLYVIKFIEPQEPNRAAWGFDAGSEVVRRSAIERAVRTGEPTITGRITLKQEHKQGAFLYLVPIYRNGSTPQTPAERESALTGLVFSAVVPAETFAGISRGVDGMLDIEVFDGDEPTRENLMLDSDGVQTAGLADGHGRSSAGGIFHGLRHIVVGGRTWTLSVTSTPAFEATIDQTGPALIAIGGIVVSALVALVIFALGRGQARALALARDMTVSLRASEAESRRLSLVASRTSNAVILADATGRIEWVNEGFERITGYKLAEVQGRKPGSFLQGPKTDSAAVDRMRTGIASGNGFDEEILNYDKSGRPYWLLAEVRPLRDEQGNLTGFMAIETDITARKEAEQRLAASEQRLSAITAQAPGVFFQFEVATDDQRSFPFLSAE